MAVYCLAERYFDIFWKPKRAKFSHIWNSTTG